MRKVFVLLAAVLMAVGVTSAAPSCANTADVLTLGGLGCDVGALNFSNFSISTIGLSFIQIGIGAVDTGTFGRSANLGFQLIHVPSPLPTQPPAGADIRLQYAVQTISGLNLISGVDLFNGGTLTTIQEVACGVPFVSGSCSEVLADFVVPSQGRLAVNFQGLESAIYIKKDIQLGPGGFISDFVNSHETGVPEPLSLLLMGSGLLALGALRWRKKNS